VQFNSSEFTGADSIMSVHLQVIDSSDISSIVIDTMLHWKNSYKVDANFKPIDKNAGINLYQINLISSLFNSNRTYFFQVRYRDHNLKWSLWSNESFFKNIGTKIGSDLIEEGYLKQNFPNPFQTTTRIDYNMLEKGNVTFRFLNAQNQLVTISDEGFKERGPHSILFNAAGLESGIYYYQLITNKTNITKEMVKTN